MAERSDVEAAIQRYIEGDTEGAVRRWVELERAGRGDPQLGACLAHARATQAALVAALEESIGRVGAGATESHQIDAGPWRFVDDVAVPVVARAIPVGWGFSEVSAGGEVAPESSVGDAQLHQQMEQLMALHDLSGALEVAERLCRAGPADGRARTVRDECRAALTTMFSGKLGSLALLPRMCVSADEVVWLGLDHRAGFILSQIDGQSSYEEILDVSGMDRLDGLRILVALVEAGTICAPR